MAQRRGFAAWRAAVEEGGGSHESSLAAAAAECAAEDPTLRVIRKLRKLQEAAAGVAAPQWRAGNIGNLLPQAE